MKCLSLTILGSFSGFRFGNDRPTVDSNTEKTTVILLSNEPVREISNNAVCATSKALDQPAHTHSLIRAFACRLNIL